MAFNLNKSGDEKPKKYNLSKSSGSPASDGEQESPGKKSSFWLLIVLAVVVLAVVGWYFTKPSNDTSVEKIASADSTIDSTLSTSLPEAASSDENPPAAGEKVTASATGETDLNSKIPATFGSGSASPSTLDDGLIAALARFLSSNPGEKVTLLGYASSEGDLQVNIALSKRRAESLKNVLISKGIPADRILTVGKGIDNPVASNETETGRKQNRRVEISL